MVWVTLLLVLIGVALLLAIATAALLAWGLTHPPRMGDGKALALLGRLSPADLGMEFLDVSFDVVDEANPPAKLRIAGWWIPAKQPSDRCVILLHGYADAKIGAIAWAPIFHSLGWNMLAIDHRAHGQSGGEFTTGGYYERHDLNQVIDQLHEQHPAATKSLVLFGVSMGSSVATETAAIRDDIAGVILESFVGDFIFASRTQTHLVGLPGGVIAKLSARFAEWFTGADFHHEIAMRTLAELKCPVLLILGTADLFVDQSEVARVAGPMSNVQLWQPSEVNHVLAMAAGHDDYRSRIEKFLDRLG